MGRRYKQGTARFQYALLPPRVEDYVGEDNTVRGIDAYVETLDMDALGFRNAGGDLAPGQPAYPPAALLKLYIFGYLNRVHSSRRLARECRRNLEAIWLVEGLAPGYRTIAEFRKLNGKALKAACKDFVALCKELDLLGGEVVAIDGAFFNASASDASVVTKTRLEKDLKQIEADIDAYCRDLDAHDQQERDGTADLGTASDLEAKLDKLKARQARKQAQIKQLQDSGETQLSRTDPDARALRKAGQKTTGYNVQNTVDAKHKIIVDHEVTNAGNDAEQLAAQAIAAKAALEVDNLIAVADAGYYSEKQLADCAAANITAYVGIPDKHRAVRAEGRFSGAQLQYVGGADVYVCPGGEVLRPQGKPAPIHGILRRRYTRPAKACQGCPLKGICLPESGAGRQIYRSEHAAVAETHGQRMAEQGRERMAQRASLVEHPFGTLKRWFGWDHFLVRGFEKVRGEMSLMVLGYNLIRVINILGLAALRDYCAQRLPRGQTATQAEVAA
jgi:transposase/cell division protein FtsB